MGIKDTVLRFFGKATISPRFTETAVETQWEHDHSGVLARSGANKWPRGIRPSPVPVFIAFVGAIISFMLAYAAVKDLAVCDGNLRKHHGDHTPHGHDPKKEQCGPKVGSLIVCIFLFLGFVFMFIRRIVINLRASREAEVGEEERGVYEAVEANPITQ